MAWFGKRRDEVQPNRTAEAASEVPAAEPTSTPTAPAERLLAPDVPPDHPRGKYHANLVAGESFTWFTTEPVELHVLVDYVLDLLEVERSELLHAQEGFAMTSDESALLTAVEGRSGRALTVWGLDARGTQRVNAAIAREWDTMMSELGRGEYAGNPARAKNAPIVRGELPADYAGSAVLDVINDGDVVPIGSAS